MYIGDEVHTLAQSTQLSSLLQCLVYFNVKIVVYICSSIGPINMHIPEMV